MPRYLLHHHHEPNECGVVFAAFRGFGARFATAGAGLLRFGGHSIWWWTVESPSQETALALLPRHLLSLARTHYGHLY